MEALPWGPASSAEAAQAGIPPLLIPCFTFQDVSLRCNPHSRRQVLLVCPQVLGIKQRWYGGTAAEGSRSGVYGVAVNHDLLQNKMKLLSPYPLLPQAASWTEQLDFFVTLSHAAIQAVTFSDLNPTGLLSCLASLFLPLLLPVLKVRCRVQCPAMFPFIGSLYQKFLCHPCPWQLIPGAEPQADATGATITS